MARSSAPGTPRGRRRSVRHRDRRGLQALERRLDRLENEVETVLGGGPVPPAPTLRMARLAPFLVAAGVILIVVAVALVIF